MVLPVELTIIIVDWFSYPKTWPSFRQENKVYASEQSRTPRIFWSPDFIFQFWNTSKIGIKGFEKETVVF